MIHEAKAAIPATCRLLGLEFSDIGIGPVTQRIADRSDRAPFSYVVTPNADHLVRLARDPSLLPLYRGAMLCLLDSRVVARTARLIGLRAPPVTTGSDLTARLLLSQVGKIGASETMTIIGLRKSHLADLVACTGISPPAHYEPPMGFEHDPIEMAKAVRFVIEHPARLVFLAVGSPRQERLAAAIAASGEARGTGLCIGASLEFVAGALPRAPVFMQRLGIEWLHRMVSDPRRLMRRYLIDNPPIFGLLLRERLAKSSR